MPDTKQNGTAISTFREIRCMSRDDLAIKLDISYPYLANIENEHKDCTTALAHRIAAILDVPVKAILRRPLYDEEQASA